IVLFAVGVAFQDNLPPQLQLHLKTLREAQSLTATVSVKQIGGDAADYQFSYQKPNLLKISGPEGFTIADGKTIYTYTAKDKTYTEAPATEEALQAVLRKDLYAWSAFFTKADKDFVKAAKAGAKRNMKGNEVTEVAITPPQEGFGVATLYVDEKLGLARAFGLKTADKEYLAMATELKVSTDPLPATDFVFTAPAGAKKVEAAAAGASLFPEVQAIMNRNCMPCHSANQRSANIDLTSYHGIRSLVVPGNTAESRLVKSLHGAGASQMPKNRPPLPDAQIKLIEQWVADGAKQ
ncbi:MAG: c-type cytochrome domain-containing protein, partial [Fimbriimonas sp.]